MQLKANLCYTVGMNILFEHRGNLQLFNRRSPNSSALIKICTYLLFDNETGGKYWSFSYHLKNHMPSC